LLGRDGGVKTAISGRAGSVKQAVADAADVVAQYVDPLYKDEKLRRRLAAAIVAGTAARRRARSQTGVTGLARRLASDRELRAQLMEMTTQLQAAQKRAKRARSRKVRNTALFLSGVGMTIAAVPAAREAVGSMIRGGRDRSAPPSWSESSTPKPPPGVDSGTETGSSTTT